ncbi:MAG: S41 family peptidase [Chitinophagaceae bacterium]
MRSFFSLLLLLIISCFVTAQNSALTTGKYREDFDFFWKSIGEEYSYFDKKQTDWEKVKAIYGAGIGNITGREQFVSLLEKALNEIYDHHAILNTNTPLSSRLVPSGTDTWAEYVNGKPVITEVRKGFGTELSGVAPGMEIIAVNDIPVDIAIKSLLPVSLKKPDIEASNFALRLVLAGDHTKERKFTLQYRGKVRDYYPDKNGRLLENIKHNTAIEARLIGTIGYIKINDCLYDTDLVPAFDSVMQTFQKTSSLIIDLRETPSGGNTIVAKALMSWFIDKEHFYQKHEYPAEETMSGIKRSWMEIVSPRKDKHYSRPLVILCDHWTASLGEAIVIGFDALKRPFTKIIGTPMARLSGAVYSYEMPNTKIRFTFPAEKLYTIDGLPREKYLPGILVDLTTVASQQVPDLFIARALSYLKNKH